MDTVWLNEVNPKQGAAVALQLPGPAAGFHATPAVRSGTIPVTYTIPSVPGAVRGVGLHAERPVGRVEFYYSINGGANWQPARDPSGSHVITATEALRPGVSHVFAWDLDASEFFGQSDDVVLRALAYTQLPGTGITNTYRYTDAVTGFFQQPVVATQTFPFRARGRQVRVVDPDGMPLAGAVVFRLPAGQFAGAQPLRDGAGRADRTDPQGISRAAASCCRVTGWSRCCP